MNYGLLIACPTYGKPGAEFCMDSLSHMMFTIGRKHPEIPAERVFLQRDVRTYREMARQGLVEAALQLGVSHILFLDDDHVFEGNVFTKLWNTMHTHELKPKVLSALYFTRTINCAPCIFKATDEGTAPIFYYPEDDLMPVDVVGYGFTLIDMRVFGELNPPWFFLGKDWGEDAALCARMKMAGFQPYVHTGAKIGHVLEQPVIIGEEHFLRVREGMENARKMEQQAGTAVGTSRLAPVVPGRGSKGKDNGRPLRSGYAKVGPGDRLRQAAPWLPTAARVWKRDAVLEGIELREDRERSVSVREAPPAADEEKA